jgi:secreted trypsin-like serine protease
VEHNDTAVLTLAQPQHRPVVPVAPARGGSGTVIGWGATGSGFDLFHAQLESATVPMVPDRVCAAAYGASFDPRDMTCAGSPKADTGMFDSGGPLLVDGKLVAITSWASGTARPGFPGVYALLNHLPDPLP